MTASHDIIITIIDDTTLDRDRLAKDAQTSAVAHVRHTEGALTNVGVR